MQWCLHMSWAWLTPLGNAVLLAPLMAAVVLVLLWRARGQRKDVLRWPLALLAAVAVVAASKIAFYGFGFGVKSWNLTGYSGHAAVALAFWPVFLMLLVPVRFITLRPLLVVAGVVLGLMVGYSRIVLGAHPPSEVLVGVILGGLVAAVGVGHLLRLELGMPVVVLLLAAMIALPLWKPEWTNMHLPSERWFARIGTELSGRDKPHRRATWLREGRPAAPNTAQPRP